MKPLLIACDFDGTITCRDTLHVIVEEFGGRGVWDALEPRLRSGEISVEEAMVQQFAAVRATRDEVMDAVRAHAPVRRGFVEFVGWARGEGHRIVVLSSGFRTVIEEVLDDAGVGDLPVHAHQAHFSEGGCALEWAERGGVCALCGRRCKRHDLAAHRGDEPVVYVGDGISDRCVARIADLIFARDSLAEDLRAEDIPFIPFDDFDDVRRELGRAYARAA